MRKPKQVALPPVPSKVPRELRPFLESVRESIQVQAGLGRGNALDKALTFRDLKGAEFSKQLVATARSNGFVQTIEGRDVDTPTQPTGVIVSASDSMVVMSWDQPSFNGYWFTQIYRTTWDGTNLIGFDESFSYRQVTGSFGDASVQPNTDYLYWLRHVNLNGEKSALSLVAGHPIKTLESLNLQDGWITNDMLENALSTRIDLIDVSDVLGVPGGLVGAIGEQDSRLTGVQTQTENNTTRVVTLETTSTNQAQQITQVSTDLAAVETRLTANEDEAFFSIKVDANGNVAGFGLTATPENSAILFSADQIGFQNGVSDVLPFSIRNDQVFISNAKIAQVEATRIINVESVGDPNKFAQLGNTFIEGDFTLAQPGQIQFKDLSASFRDRLVQVDPNAEVTGGTRTRTIADPTAPQSIYLSREFGLPTSSDEPIPSGGASTTVSVTVNGGVGYAVEYGGNLIAPSIRYSIYRRNIDDDVTETLVDSRVATGVAVNNTPPGEPEDHWCNINDSFSLNTPLPTSGKEYEYWIEVEAKSGNWSINGSTGGTLIASVQETLGSSGGVLVETLAYQGTQYFSVNDGGNGSGASVIFGDLFVDNFSRRIADATGNLYSNSQPVWHSGNFNPSIKADVSYVDSGLATKLDVTGKAADSELLDGLNSTSYFRSDNVNTADVRLANANGIGVRFKDSNSYKFYYSQRANEPYGCVEFDTAGNENMYFRMSGLSSNGWVFWNGASSTSPAAQLKGNGELFVRDVVFAKSHGSGDLLAKVMTWEDFTYQDDPPVGLEDVITANWIQAGAIRAHHLQVQTTGNESGNQSGVAIELNPLSESPISIRDRATDDTVFSVQIVDGQAQAVVNGTAGPNFLKNLDAIPVDIRKALNQYYLGSSSSASATPGNMTSGSDKNFSISTSASGRAIVSFTLRASASYTTSPTNLGYSKPIWRIQIRRNSTNGTILFDKIYEGTAFNSFEPDFGWDGTANLTVNGNFVDEVAPVNSSEVYVLLVTRNSGTPTTIDCQSFVGEVPSFLENSIGRTANGFWKCKDTGFTVQWGSVSMAANSVLVVTLPTAFDTFCASAQVNSAILDFNTSSQHKVHAKNQTSITINNAFNSTQTGWWLAIGY